MPAVDRSLSDCRYVWARTWADKRADKPDQGLEIEKRWYSFMMWGRCAFQICDEEHSLGTDFWVSELSGAILH